MKIYVIFGQRIESYEGQYAPEALDVQDENGRNEENPLWLEQQVERHKNTGEFIAVDIFEIDLGNGAIAAIEKRLLEPHQMTGTITGAGDSHD